MKIKTSELAGSALDWAVAKADYWSEEGLQSIAEGCAFPAHDFSTNWSLGGPVIEREGISLECWHGRTPLSGYTEYGYYWEAASRAEASEHYGYTPLIAAMRCYVASKLGDEVDIPDELTK